MIPAEYIDVIAKEVNSMTIYEDFVMREVKKGKSIKGLYPLTDKEIKTRFEKTIKLKT